MRSRFRLAFWAAPLASAALGVVSLLTQFIGGGSRTFDHLLGWATIASVPAALVAFFVAAREKATNSSSAAEPDLDLAEQRLGLMLENEADAGHSPMLDPAGMGHLVNLRFDKVASPFRDYGGLAAGDLACIAEYFKSLSLGRLVVLGKPGSGKTALALGLHAQLLKSRGQDGSGPLPVLVNAASYDPGNTWANWLAGHLAQRYALPGRVAAQLILGGRILPIIDGVGELERVRAAALFTELNAFIREQEPSHSGERTSLVVTCREAQYQDLAEPLDEATHIELRPLVGEDVKSYLRERGIESPDGLASALSSPLLLSLAGSVYGAGTRSSQPIGDLLRLPDEKAVERQLLAAFVVNAGWRISRGRNWLPAQAERWLAVIGSQMRALSTERYTWRQVAYAMPAWLLGLLSGTATGFGLAVTFAALGLTHQVFGNRVPRGTAIGSLAALSIVPAIVAGLLVAGVSSGRLFSWLVSLMADADRVGARVSAAVTAAASLRNWPAASRRELQSQLIGRRQGTGSRALSPRADISRARTGALIGAAVAGGTLGILAVASALAGAYVPQNGTIVFVCYCMAVIVMCAPWGCFQIARAWFSVTNALPYRLLGFLDSADESGVLRSTGPRFGFRNHAVRGYFTDPVRRPEVSQEIATLSEWVLGNLEIREAYRNVGADEADIEQAVSSLATETILAGYPFTASAAMREEALEHVRVRLNELGRRTAFEESLAARKAPGLGAAIDPSWTVLTRTMDDLARLMDRIPSASVGISGIRGIGKSTLIRWLCTERNAGRRLPHLGIYVTAPVEYDARDFLVHLHTTLCNAVLADGRLTDHRARRRRSLRRRVASAVTLIAAAAVLYSRRGVDHAVTAWWAHDQGSLWSAAESLLFTGGLWLLVSVIGDLQRKGGGGARTSLETTARNQLRRLRYQMVETSGHTGNLSGPFGLSFSRSRSRQVTENQMTLPELVERYREFAGLTVNALQKSTRRDGPLASAQVRLVVGIDEIDRIEDAGNAEKFLNDIKAIFGISNCFYVASLSADALANFERRVVSTRTAFDTTFDTVLRIAPLELAIARQLLERRAIGLPYPFITLCYVLSGGVPRDLIRIARSIFEVRDDMRPGTAEEDDEEAVACAVIAPRVIIREMESLRQGLMPLATQLNVPGATGLIELLDDPDWPSGDMRDSLAQLAEVIGHRALFQDETRDIASATKICDGLAAASYFFLSVDELFRSRLDQVIAELKSYDAASDRQPDLAASLHLLARARAAIGVNPALAVSRVRKARKSYGLPDVTPVLLSEHPANSVHSPGASP